MKRTTYKTDPLKYLLHVMADEEAPAELRLKAAIAAAPYSHAKGPAASAGAGGIKAARQAAAEQACDGGKFAPARPPKLVVSNA